MPATALDPKTALVLIDLQKGLSSFPTVHPFGDIVANAVRLVDAFRAAALPIAFVTVGPSPDGGDALTNRVQVRLSRPYSAEAAELVPELAAKPADLRVHKRQPNAFYGTELDLQLRRRHVTGIVLAGIATSIGVDTTGRAAHERGYNVTFASDAMTDIDAAAHEVTITKTFPRLGEIDTTDAIVALLRAAR